MQLISAERKMAVMDIYHGRRLSHGLSGGSAHPIMKQRLPLTGTELVWCCPEHPVIHYVLPLSHVILDLILVHHEREADQERRWYREHGHSKARAIWLLRTEYFS